MFFKKKETRSIEEILTPKQEDCEEKVEILDECESDEEKDDPKVEKAKVKKEGAFDRIIDDLDFDPAVYYGWGEGKMDKKMQKVTEFWKGVASVVWFLFGSLTFAPVLFTAGKIDQFLNDKKRSFWSAAIIYSFSLSIIIYLLFFKK